jgi:hypothetical protein
MSSTDKKTLELIAQVKEKKSAIEKAEKPSYKTNRVFSYAEGNKSNTININVETDVRKLVCIASFLIERSSNYELTAKKVFGIEKLPPFTWDGFTLDDWLSDLKTRVTKVQIVTEKKKLEALESRLNKIISPEKRAELELEAIASELE